MPRLSQAARACASLALALIVCAAVAAFGAGEGDDQMKPKLRQTLVPASGIRTVSGDTPANSRPGEALYSSPPGSGAGETGFISTNTPIRRAKKGKKVLKPKTVAAAASARVTPVVGAGATTTAGLATRRPSRAAKVEEDPYGPVGVRTGSFLTKPSLELSEGYDDNPFRTANRQGSRFTTVVAKVDTRSQWSRHELGLDLRGAYTTFSEVQNNDRPEAEAKLRGRIDVNSTSRIELEGKAALTTAAAGTPDAITSAVRPPNIYTFGGSLGYVQRFNRFEVGLRGSVERSTYENAKLISGAIEDLSDRNYTSYGGKLRGGYEVTPGIKPFVEAGLDTRVFDHEIDFDGVRRGSDGVAARAGVQFERKGWLTGEASAGFSRRSYRDPNLQDISGLIVDSSLVWQATGLTKVTLKAISEIEETRLIGASGLFKREAKITVEHAFRRWLIGSVSALYGLEDYRGVDRLDQRLGLSATLTYHLNRMFALKGELRHERLHSNVPDQDYTANIVLVGLKLQR